MVRPILAALALCATAFALPVTEGETLAGRKLAVPTAFAGQPAVLLFSFSREAGEKIRPWMEPLLKDGRNVWSVANLEGAPRFVRGMIRSGMRKDTPAPVQERTIILEKDTGAWRQSLSVQKDNAPVVVLLDAKGAVAWKHQGFYDEAPYRELLKRLAAL